MLQTHQDTLDERSTEAAKTASGPAHGSFRELLQVAVPLMLSAGTLSIMNVADRAMLTGWSRDALAAVMPAGMLHWTVICIPMGMILYANTFIAQFDGAGQPRKLMSSLWQAIWLALTCGILLMLCPLFSGPVLAFTGQSAGVVTDEKAYFDTLCLGGPLVMVSMALSCFYSGRRRTNVILAVNIISVLINFGMDYVLIFGRFGFPAMGIQGAALATLAGRFGEVGLYAFLITRQINRRQYFDLATGLGPAETVLSFRLSKRSSLFCRLYRIHRVPVHHRQPQSRRFSRIKSGIRNQCPDLCAFAGVRHRRANTGGPSYRR